MENRVWGFFLPQKYFFLHQIKSVFVIHVIVLNVKEIVCMLLCKSCISGGSHFDLACKTDNKEHAYELCFKFFTCTLHVLVLQTNSAYMLFYERKPIGSRTDVDFKAILDEPQPKFNFELTKDLGEVSLIVLI